MGWHSRAALGAKARLLWFDVVVRTPLTRPRVRMPTLWNSHRPNSLNKIIFVSTAAIDRYETP
jgi:hypothetical protein